MKSLAIAALSTLPGFLVAWLLSNYFKPGDYTFFLLIQNLTIGLNLCLNFGLNTFMLKYKPNSQLSCAFSDVKIIYAFYFISSVLATTIYYFLIFDSSINLINFLIISTISSISFLLANNFQQFYIGQGQMNYAHIRFVAGPKLLALLILISYYFLSLSFIENAAWFYLIQLIFIIFGINIFRKSFSSIKNTLSIIRTFSHQWGTYLLHGIFGPLLILIVYDVDRELVATLGIGILLSQPARMIYQFSIQTKIKAIKEQILSGSRTFDISKIYKNLVIQSSALIILYVIFIIIFERIISELIFPNIDNILQYTLIFISYQLINALFGPNGTLLGLIDAAKYDSRSAFVKILLFLFLIYLDISVHTVMLLMMFVEIAINIYKNIHLSKFLNKNLNLFPPSLFGVLIILIEVAYFGI